MDYQALQEELVSDPLERGYSTMSDEEAATDLNTVYRTKTRASMTGDEIFQQTNTSEFVALTDHRQSLWLSFCARDQVDPVQSNNVSFVTTLFGSGSVTVSNLADARTEDVSRAVELGLGSVSPGHVTKARAL